MYVVDASVWVSRFVHQDVNHSTSSAWLSRLVRATEAIFEPAVLPAEVAGAVARRTGSREHAVNVAGLLFSSPTIQIVSVDTGLGQAAARLASDLRMRGVDAVYVALARRLGMPLVTWDWEQRERAGPVIRAMTPEEALRA